MTDKYSLKGKIKKLEVEMWNLKVKGIDVVSYNQHFQELALMCVRMFPEELEKIKSTLAKHQVENKIKLNNNNQTQQQPPKKQGVAIAYTVGPGERKEYAGTLPLCNKSHVATNNQRNSTCYECGNQRHYRSDCLELKNQNHKNQAGGTGARGMVHVLELKNQNHKNQDFNDIEGDINA
nr:hypothetical protein [Tanacetum cinerariifolium]